MKIWAYGDSFIAGDQDIPGRIDAETENLEFNRYNYSFASHVAKKLNITLINRGMSGCSNYSQLDLLWRDAPEISSDDIVLFSLSTSWRDRFIIPHRAPNFLADHTGEGIVSRKLILEDYQHRIAVVDFYYTLSVIERLETQYNFKCLKINGFHNCLIDASVEDKKRFKFKDTYVGQELISNTLLDLLTDNWGKETPRLGKSTSDHNYCKVIGQYSHRLTAKGHPNVNGHEFIANWIIDQLKRLRFIE